MYGLFLQILIDAGLMMGVLAIFQDTEISLGLAAVLGFLTAVITAALAWGLARVMGPAGVYVAILVAALLLGIVLSALFGLEIKRAIMVAGIFMAAHIVVGLILSSMMKAPATAALQLLKLQPLA